jgi:hypothetical protein
MPNPILLSSEADGTIFGMVGGVLEALSGQSVYVYQPGTTTQVTVYANSACTAVATQPLTTTATGTIPGYVDGTQEVDFYDATTATRITVELLAAAETTSAVSTEVSRAEAAEAGLMPKTGGTFSGAILVPTPPSGAVAGTAPNIGWVESYVESNGLTAPGIGSGIDPTGASDSTTALNALISSAITNGQEIVLPPGTFNISAKLTAALTSSNPNFRLRGAGAGKTIINATATGFPAFDIGFGIGSPLVANTGWLKDLSVIGPFVPGTTTQNYIGGVQLDGAIQFHVENVQVNGFDVGYDLINNCYGSHFTNIRAGFAGTCNVAVRLRTGQQSGSDISFYNPWLNGVLASVYVENDASDASAGFNFYGGQYSSGTIGATSDSPNLGCVTIGKNYQTGVVNAGEPRQVVFNSGDFEAVSRMWNFKLFAHSSLVVNGTRFDDTGSGGVSGTAPLGLLSHATPYDDAISFRDIELTGTVKNQLIDYVPAGGSPVLTEIGTNGKPVLYTPVTAKGAASIGSAVTVNVGGPVITAGGAVSIGSAVTVPISTAGGIPQTLVSGSVLTWSGGGVLTLTATAPSGSTSLVGNLATAAIASGNTTVSTGIANFIPSGTAITFSGTGVLTLTANAAVGATSLTGNLATANIASGQTANPSYSCDLFQRGLFDRQNLQSGTAIHGGILMLNGLRVQNNAGQLQQSPDGVAWSAINTPAGSRAGAYCTTTTVLGAGSNVTIPLNNADALDDANRFLINLSSAGTNPNTIQILEAGLYVVTIKASFLATAGNDGLHWLFGYNSGDLNALRTTDQAHGTSADGSHNMTAVSAPVRLAAGSLISAVARSAVAGWSLQESNLCTGMWITFLGT